MGSKVLLAPQKKEFTQNICDAFSFITTFPNDIVIVSAENEQIKTNRMLLNFYSPTMIPLLSSPSTIIVPDCSSRSIKNLLGIITKGFAYEYSTFDINDILEVVETGRILGIKVKNLDAKVSNNDSQESTNEESYSGADKNGINEKVSVDSKKGNTNKWTQSLPIDPKETFQSSSKEDLKINHIKTELVDHDIESTFMTQSVILPDNYNPFVMEDQINYQREIKGIGNNYITDNTEICDNTVSNLSPNNVLCEENISETTATYKQTIEIEELKKKYAATKNNVLNIKKEIIDQNEDFTMMERENVPNNQLPLIQIQEKNIHLPLQKEAKKVGNKKNVDEHLLQENYVNKGIEFSTEDVVNNIDTFKPMNDRIDWQVDLNQIRNNITKMTEMEEINNTEKAYDTNSMNETGHVSEFVAVDSNAEEEDTNDYVVTAKGLGMLTKSDLSAKTSSPSTEKIKNKNNLNVRCQMCSMNLRNWSILKRHYIVHFKTDLQKYTDIVLNKKCLPCDKPFSLEYDGIRHVALNHDKINEILVEKGFQPIGIQSGVSKIVGEDKIEREIKSESTIISNLIFSSEQANEFAKNAFMDQSRNQTLVKSMKKVVRVKFSKQQVKLLMAEFVKSENLSDSVCTLLVNSTGLKRKQIIQWFRNEKKKKKQLLPVKSETKENFEQNDSLHTESNYCKQQKPFLKEELNKNEEKVETFKKKKFSKEQIILLMEQFDKSEILNPSSCSSLASRTGLRIKQIMEWFRKERLRRKQTMAATNTSNKMHDQNEAVINTTNKMDNQNEDGCEDFNNLIQQKSLLKEEFNESEEISDSNNVKKKKKITKFSNQQISLLMAEFERSRMLNESSCTSLVNNTGLKIKQIRLWFKNERIRRKRNVTSSSNTTKSERSVDENEPLLIDSNFSEWHKPLIKTEMPAVMNSKKRRYFSKQQIDLLMGQFAKSTVLNESICTSLANSTGLKMLQVRRWFKNERNKRKHTSAAINNPTEAAINNPIESEKGFVENEANFIESNYSVSDITESEESFDENDSTEQEEGYFENETNIIESNYSVSETMESEENFIGNDTSDQEESLMGNDNNFSEENYSEQQTPLINRELPELFHTKRKRFYSQEQVALLTAQFNKSEALNSLTCSSLANSTGLKTKQIRKWFENQKSKKRTTTNNSKDPIKGSFDQNESNYIESNSFLQQEAEEMSQGEPAEKEEMIETSTTKKITKSKFSTEQVALLKAEFEKSEILNISITTSLSKSTGLNIVQVRSWFKNERKRKRKSMAVAGDTYEHIKEMFDED